MTRFSKKNTVIFSFRANLPHVGASWHVAWGKLEQMNMGDYFQLKTEVYY